MQTTSKVLCLLAEHLQRKRNPRELMWCMPEVPKLPAKGTHDTLRNPFETMANCECRFVSHTRVVVPNNRRLLFQVPICQKVTQPHG